MQLLNLFLLFKKHLDNINSADALVVEIQGAFARNIDTGAGICPILAVTYGNFANWCALFLGQNFKSAAWRNIARAIFYSNGCFALKVEILIAEK